MRSCWKARPAWERRRSGVQASRRPRSACPACCRRFRRRARRHSASRVSPTSSTASSTRRLASLPQGQRSALSRALVLEEAPDGAVPDAHAVGVALLGVLRSLGADNSLVIAVDDVQWLDVASAGALAYATRRLRDERVGVLLSRRSGLASPFLDELRRALAGDRCVEVEVGPLDAADLHRVVQEHLGVALPRPLLVGGASGVGRKSVLRTRVRSHAEALGCLDRGGATLARSRVASRPRSRPRAGAPSGESRLSPRGRGARPSDDRDHRGGVGRLARCGPDTGNRSARRRARRPASPVHAPASRRGGLRVGRSAQTRRGTCPPRGASRRPRGARLAAVCVRRTTGRDGRLGARERRAACARARRTAAGGTSPRSRRRADACGPRR